MRKLYQALSLLLVMLMMAGCFAGCQQTPQGELKTPDFAATEAPSSATSVPEPMEEPRAKQRIVCLAPSMVEVVSGVCIWTWRRDRRLVGLYRLSAGGRAARGLDALRGIL